MAWPPSSASWTVYQDETSQVWTAQGYATGAGPSYTFTLVNPVSITIFDEDGRMTDQISAIRASISGELSASDSFPQSSYCRWTHKGRQNKVTSPGGTITRTVFDARNLALSVYVGTNVEPERNPPRRDNGATDRRTTQTDTRQRQENGHFRLPGSNSGSMNTLAWGV